MTPLVSGKWEAFKSVLQINENMNQIYHQTQNQIGKGIKIMFMKSVSRFFS